MAKKTKDKKKDAAPTVVTKTDRSKLTTETLKTIAAQVKAKKAAQAAVDGAVIKARGEGCSWVQIAAALGISPQGARQKYLSRIPA
jgi:chromosome segregation and condensation protein ScpB